MEDMKIKTIKTKNDNCPYCGKEFDCATELNGEVKGPSSGDWSVCIACAKPLRFDDELNLRKITKSEVVEIPLKLMQAMLAIRKYNADKKSSVPSGKFSLAS